jgi:hypothetical protein
MSFFDENFSTNVCKSLAKEKITVSLKDVYNCLKKFHLSDGLYQIGLILAALEKIQIHKKEIPSRIIKWISHAKTVGQHEVSLRVNFTNMARFLILSGSNDYKGEKLTVDHPSFIDAYNMVSNLYDEKITTPSELNAHFARIAQKQFMIQPPSMAGIIGRGHLLFLQIPSEIKCNYDFDAKLKSYHRIGILEFIASGFCEWVSSTGAVVERRIEVEKLKLLATDYNRQIFRNLSSGKAKKYREYIRGPEYDKKKGIINKSSEIHGPEPFFMMPLIEVERSDIKGLKYVVPQPIYLLYRATLGIFNILADQEMSSGKEQNNFRIEFGNVYEHYVGKLLSTVKDPSLFIRLGTEVKGLPDFAIIEDSICILFEVKLTILDLETRTLFREDKIKKEIESGHIGKAIKQFNNFERIFDELRSKDSRFKNVKKIMKIIVGFDEIFNINHVLLPKIKDIHGEKFGENLQIASITDLEILAGFLSSDEGSLNKVVQKLTEPDCYFWSFQVYLTSLGHPILNAAYDEFLRKII